MWSLATIWCTMRSIVSAAVSAAVPRRTIATGCHALRKRLPFGPTNDAAGTTPLEDPALRAAAARRAQMLRTPKLRCKSEQPALGSSRPKLRTPASAGHPSQSSSGRDTCGRRSDEGGLLHPKLHCPGEGCARRNICVADALYCDRQRTHPLTVVDVANLIARLPSPATPTCLLYHHPDEDERNHDLAAEMREGAEHTVWSLAPNWYRTGAEVDESPTAQRPLGKRTWRDIAANPCRAAG